MNRYRRSIVSSSPSCRRASLFTLSMHKLGKYHGMKLSGLDIGEVELDAKEQRLATTTSFLSPTSLLEYGFESRFSRDRRGSIHHSIRKILFDKDPYLHALFSQTPKCYDIVILPIYTTHP